MAVRMHEKTLVGADFFINISIPFFTRATGHIFDAILTSNTSNDVFLQQLVPFGGLDLIWPLLWG